MSKIDIGILESDCNVVVYGFKKLFVDLYMFYFQIYNFYWNVEGL